MIHPDNSPNGPGSSASRATSHDLLGRARTGDATAWGQLVTLYAPLVYFWCRRRELREPDAADVVQDVFQAVALHLDQFDDRRQGGSFRGWLRTITENKIRDHFRRTSDAVGGAGGTDAQRRLTEVQAPSPSDGDDDDPWDVGFLRRALDLVRDEFEERTWQAFWRTAIDGHTPADVGAELSMSAGAVRVAKCRVIKRLRQELGEIDPSGI